MTATALQEIEVATPRRRWPRYPDYKPTGLPWLPKAPTHWSAKRLRYAVRFPTKGEVRGLPLDTLVSFVPMEAVGEYGGLSLDQTRPIEEVLNGYTYFRNGDVLVAKITPCFENGKGALAERLENGLGFGTTELHVLRAGAEILPKYLFYLTLGEHFRKLGTAEMYGAGGQKRVPERFIQNLKHPLPPLDEQRAIAAFLDRETARIDELIAKKQRLIELLKEKRQAVISRAVTKGLDPTAPMKPSGIDWLGDVPMHWDTQPLKYQTLKIGSGKTPRGGAEVYVSSGVMLLRSQNIHDDGMRLDDVVFIDDDADAEMANTRVKPRDVLLNITGASIGRCSIASNDLPRANVNQHVCIIRPKRMKPEYLHAILCSKGIKDWIQSQENGTSREGLNFRQVGNLWIPIPPEDEQNEIVCRLQKTSSELDSLIRRVHDAAGRLLQYRSALITAAVTGQIDVRGIVQ